MKISALEQLKSAVDMGASRKTVMLPNGTEFVFWSSPLTLAERAKAKKQAPGDDVNSFGLQLIVNKAKDDVGQPLFTVADLPELKAHLPGELVEEIMLRIINNSPDEAAEVEEKEEINPKSSSRNSGKTES